MAGSEFYATRASQGSQDPDWSRRRAGSRGRRGPRAWPRCSRKGCHQGRLCLLQPSSSLPPSLPPALPRLSPGAPPHSPAPLGRPRPYFFLTLSRSPLPRQPTFTPLLRARSSVLAPSSPASPRRPPGPFPAPHEAAAAPFTIARPASLLAAPGALPPASLVARALSGRRRLRRWRLRAAPFF